MTATLVTTIVILVVLLLMFSRALERETRWREKNRRQDLETIRRLQEERKEARIRAGSAENQLQSAEAKLARMEAKFERVERNESTIEYLRAVIRQQQTVTSFNGKCKKQFRFATQEEADEAAVDQQKWDGKSWEGYECMVCLTKAGQPVFHVAHTNVDDRVSRQRRINKERHTKAMGG